MTDLPRAALFICGTSATGMINTSRTADVLAVSLRSAGMNVSARTAHQIASPSDASSLRDTLLHLASVNDLVITVGAVGFGGKDILPDITSRLCTGRADYFTGILCGAYPLPRVTGIPPSSGPSPLPPFIPAAERRARAKRLPSLFTHRTKVSRPSDAPTAYVPHPSRAFAGICRKTLLVNFPADLSDARLLADALLPSLAYAVFRLCGKCAASVTLCDDSVNVFPYF